MMWRKKHWTITVPGIFAKSLIEEWIDRGDTREQIAAELSAVLPVDQSRAISLVDEILASRGLGAAYHRDARIGAVLAPDGLPEPENNN